MGKATPQPAAAHSAPIQLEDSEEDSPSSKKPRVGPSREEAGSEGGGPSREVGGSRLGGGDAGGGKGEEGTSTAKAAEEEAGEADGRHRGVDSILAEGSARLNSRLEASDQVTPCSRLTLNWRVRSTGCPLFVSSTAIIW